ncbi:MAG: glycosyltransferase family 4 protein [Marinilabilia sp.]
MKIAILSPVAWRTPPRQYGPWEQVASNIAEGLVERGHDVTLFATLDSRTHGQLDGIVPTGYEEDKETDPKVAECLHISYLMEKAGQFDIIHNHFDFLPLTYTGLISTPMVTTIHGFSSPRIVPVYKRYNSNNFYVSISHSDRNPELEYVATVYNGIDARDFTLNETPEDYLLYFGRIHHDKGTREAIEIARKSGKRLVIAGIIQDREYFDKHVAPHVDNRNVVFEGSAGPEKRDRLLKNAKALLHPINFEEPFGLSVAEAMFCGTPVIAFNKGSMPELIKDGATGFLVHSVDEAVSKVPELENIDRRYCRDWAANHFSCDKMVDDYVQVYEGALEKSL